MNLYRTNFFSNIVFLTVGFFIVVSPTALTNGVINSGFSFYPDLLLCLIFSTILNRPQRINLFAILLLLLFSDVLHMKPLGLFTMIVLVAYLIIKRYEQKIEQLLFYSHYLIFFFVIMAIQITYISVHYLFFMPIPSLAIVLNQTIFTLICYPLFDIPYKLQGMSKK
jgi:rod shape-determining protein MreD